MGLVSKCSNTLESLTISCHDFGVFAIASAIFWFLTVVRERRRAAFARPLKISTATKLKDVAFRSEGSLRWINAVLETIKSKELQWVTVKSWHVLVDYREGEDLDHALAQLWTSRSVRPTILFSRKGRIMELVPKLLPELTKEGAVDVFEHGED